MATFESDLGKVTAYAYAVDAGYQGTEAEFEEDLLNAVSTFETDKTLAVEDKAADSKITGDAIAELKNDISDIATNTNLNLFDGIFMEGYISGAGSGARISANESGKIIALDIEPNTTYSIIKEVTDIESSYYWLKVATSTKIKAEFLATIGSSGWSTYFDGSVWYNGSSSVTCVTNYTFTTGANDKSVFILVARALTPYCEVVKGTSSVLQWDNYNPIYSPMYLDCYSKSSADDKFEFKKPLYVTTGTNEVTVYEKQGNQYLGYKYGLFTNSAIHVNVWRLYDISVYDQSFSLLWTINPVTSDVEGVIKISGEADYLGSVHGDEQMTGYTIILDGKPIDISSITDGYYESVEFLVGSNVYHADDPDNIAFVKQKATKITVDGVSINNKYTAQSAMTIDRIRLTMNVPKVADGTRTVSMFYDSIVNLLPTTIPADSSTGDIGYSTKLRDVTMAGDKCNIAVETIRLGGTDSRGRITMFTDRLKPYFDCYMSNDVSANEGLYAEYRYKITI